MTEDGKLKFEPELLALDAFRDLWERDKSKDKTAAMKDFSFIWFMLSVGSNNSYAAIGDKTERYEMVKRDVYDGKGNPMGDKAILRAIELYKERNPKNGYEENAEFIYRQIKDLRRIIDGMDKEAVDEQGKLLLKPAEFAKAIGEINKMVKDYEEMRKLGKEAREEENSKIRGGGKAGMFEDEIDYMD